MGKVQGWGSKHLNQAGKEVLIKSVLQSIPMYPFVCIKAPAGLCSQLNSVISKFWWGNGGNKGKIRWGAWSKLSAPKGVGGMGFKDFSSFNTALLAKQFWRLINSLNAFWVKVLKGLYFPNRTSLEAVRGSSPSWIWCSLMEGKRLLQEGLRWNVGNGVSIRFWEDKWIPNFSEAKLNSRPPADCAWTSVANFIDQSSHSWDLEKLRSCVNGRSEGYFQSPD